jgi:hypothetical protein
LSTKIKWLVLVGGVLAAASVFLAIAVQVNQAMGANFPDYLVYWAAGRLVSQGLSPYVPAVWESLVYEIEWTFPYPMAAAILLVPWGLLTYRFSYILWMFLSMALVTSSTLLLVNEWKISSSARYLFPILAGLATFRPVLVAIRNGQMVPVLLFALVLSIFLASRKKYLLAGIACAFLFLKPSIGIPIMGLMGLWWLHQRNYRSAIGLGSASIFLFGIGFVIEPLWLQQLLTYDANQTILGRFEYCPTLWGMANLACPDSGPCVYWLGSALILFAFIGMLVGVWKKKMPVFLAAGLFSAFTFLCAPYAWTYEHVLLIIPILYGMGELIRRKAPFLLSATIFLLFSIFSLILLLVGMRISVDMWSALLPLICFVWMLVLVWRLPQSSGNNE